MARSQAHPFPSVQNGTRPGAIFVVALTIAFCLHLASFLRFPAPFVDEAWAANRAWALLTTGVAFGDLDAGVFEHFPAYKTYNPMLPTAIQAVPLWLAGQPLLWPLRATSLLFGSLLAASVYQLGKRFGDRETGEVACVLTALSTPFAYSAHLARWDIIIAAAGYGALALQVGNAARKPWRAALAGLLVGLAFEIHPHAAIFVAAAFGWYVLESGWRAVQRQDVRAWLAGLAVGGGVYVAFHFTRHPWSFLELAHLAHGPTHTPPLATLEPRVLVESLTSALWMIFEINPFCCVAFLVAFLWLFARHRQRGSALLLALLVFGSFVLLVRNRFLYYVILVAPSLDLAVAAFLVHAVRGPRPLRFERASAVIAMSLLLLGAGLTMTLGRLNGYREFNGVISRLAPTLDSRDILMGSQTYWLGLSQHRYLSWEQLVYYRRLYPSATLEDALRTLGPTVFIIDDHLRFFMHDERHTGPYAGQLDVPRRELLSVLNHEATLIADFDGDSYGRLQAYRFNWAAQGAAKPAETSPGRVGR